MNTENTRNIICPYCGYEDLDSWEMTSETEEEETIKIECTNCEKKFDLIYHIVLTYSSFKLKNKEHKNGTN